jgi:hypothetical protein
MPRPSREERIDYLLDRTEIFDLIRYERLCRDIKDWEGLVGSYVPGSPVRTTWFDGTIEAFAAASKAKMETGSAGKHWIFPTKLNMKDGRATVESPAYIFDRLTFDGIEFDFMAHVRFVSRAVQTDDGWRLASFEGIYARDSLLPVNPKDTLPIDWDIVNSMRPSYRFIGFCQAYRGYKVSQDLLGDDRPDQLAEFYAAERRWVETGE